jgi:hypothetical protein
LLLAAVAAMCRQVEQHENKLATAGTTIARPKAQLARAEVGAGKDMSEATNDEAAMTAMASGHRP